MRVLDKTVQVNEDLKPVLLITLELPLTLGESKMQNGDFMAAFVEAIEVYENQQAAEKKDGNV